MRRREFIVGIGLSSAWPLAAKRTSLVGPERTERDVRFLVAIEMKAEA
jgi:hypothetical protein